MSPNLSSLKPSENLEKVLKKAGPKVSEEMSEEDKKKSIASFLNKLGLGNGADAGVQEEPSKKATKRKNNTSKTDSKAAKKPRMSQKTSGVSTSGAQSQVDQGSDEPQVDQKFVDLWMTNCHKILFPQESKAPEAPGSPGKGTSSSAAGSPQMALGQDRLTPGKNDEIPPGSAQEAAEKLASQMSLAVQNQTPSTSEASETSTIKPMTHIAPPQIAQFAPQNLQAQKTMKPPASQPSLEQKAPKIPVRTVASSSPFITQAQFAYLFLSSQQDHERAMKAMRAAAGRVPSALKPPGKPTTRPLIPGIASPRLASTSSSPQLAHNSHPAHLLKAPQSLKEIAQKAMRAPATQPSSVQSPGLLGQSTSEASTSGAPSRMAQSSDKASPQPESRQELIEKAQELQNQAPSTSGTPAIEPSSPVFASPQTTCDPDRPALLNIQNDINDSEFSSRCAQTSAETSASQMSPEKSPEVIAPNAEDLRNQAPSSSGASVTSAIKPLSPVIAPTQTASSSSSPKPALMLKGPQRLQTIAREAIKVPDNMSKEDEEKFIKSLLNKLGFGPGADLEAREKWDKNVTKRKRKASKSDAKRAKKPNLSQEPSPIVDSAPGSSQAESPAALETANDPSFKALCSKLRALRNKAPEAQVSSPENAQEAPQTPTSPPNSEQTPLSAPKAPLSPETALVQKACFSPSPLPAQKLTAPQNQASQPGSEQAPLPVSTPSQVAPLNLKDPLAANLARAARSHNAQLLKMFQNLLKSSSNFSKTPRGLRGLAPKKQFTLNHQQIEFLSNACQKLRISIAAFGNGQNQFALSPQQLQRFREGYLRLFGTSVDPQGATEQVWPKLPELSVQAPSKNQTPPVAQALSDAESIKAQNEAEARRKSLEEAAQKEAERKAENAKKRSNFEEVLLRIQKAKMKGILETQDQASQESTEQLMNLAQEKAETHEKTLRRSSEEKDEAEARNVAREPEIVVIEDEEEDDDDIITVNVVEKPLQNRPKSFYQDFKEWFGTRRKTSAQVAKEQVIEQAQEKAKAPQNTEEIIIIEPDNAAQEQDVQLVYEEFGDCRKSLDQEEMEAQNSEQIIQPEDGSCLVEEPEYDYEAKVERAQETSQEQEEVLLVQEALEQAGQLAQDQAARDKACQDNLDWIEEAQEEAENYRTNLERECEDFVKMEAKRAQEEEDYYVKLVLDQLAQDEIDSLVEEAQEEAQEEAKNRQNILEKECKGQANTDAKRAQEEEDYHVEMVQEQDALELASDEIDSLVEEAQEEAKNRQNMLQKECEEQVRMETRRAQEEQDYYELLVYHELLEEKAATERARKAALEVKNNLWAKTLKQAKRRLDREGLAQKLAEIVQDDVEEEQLETEKAQDEEEDYDDLLVQEGQCSEEEVGRAQGLGESEGAQETAEGAQEEVEGAQEQDYERSPQEFSQEQDAQSNSQESAQEPEDHSRSQEFVQEQEDQLSFQEFVQEQQDKLSFQESAQKPEDHSSSQEFVQVQEAQSSFQEFAQEQETQSSFQESAQEPEDHSSSQEFVQVQEDQLSFQEPQEETPRKSRAQEQEELERRIKHLEDVFNKRMQEVEARRALERIKMGPSAEVLVPLTLPKGNGYDISDWTTKDLVSWIQRIEEPDSFQDLIEIIERDMYDGFLLSEIVEDSEAMEKELGLRPGYLDPLKKHADRVVELWRRD